MVSQTHLVSSGISVRLGRWYSHRSYDRREGERRGHTTQEESVLA